MPLVALNLSFDQTSLTVPADSTFAIAFDNRDGVPHNVNVRGNGITRESDPFTGPATRTFDYAGVPAGTYTFFCSVHPDMTGVLNSVAGGG